jgi:putative serine protease PepD
MSDNFFTRPDGGDDQPSPEEATPHDAAPQEPAQYQPEHYQPPQYQPEQPQLPQFPAQPYQPQPYRTEQYPSAPYPSAQYPSAQYPLSGPSTPSPYGSFGGYQPPAPPMTLSSPPGPSATAQRSRRRAVLAGTVVAAVIGGLIGGGIVAAIDHKSNSSVASGVVVTTQTAQDSPKLNGSVTAAAAKIMPSVVTINVSGQSESGTGSGIVLRSDGYILTNNHVVAVAGSGGQIQVVTRTGQTAPATIVGTDQSDDLAVVKISGLSLPAATFAKSSELQVGQTVVAVGAPLGLSNTVTSGIVSNTARPVQTGDSSTDTAVFDAIQTDAAINPGNSGGPLVDLNGNVVGVDAAIADANSGGVTVPGQPTQSGSIGIGFAIPSDEASRIAAELIATGTATHAVIGVTVNDGSAPQSSIQTTAGATLATVSPNSPASKAGLQAGDVVSKVNDQLITQNIDLIAAVRSYAPGQTVTLTYIRAGATHTVQVTLGTASS